MSGDMVSITLRLPTKLHDRLLQLEETEYLSQNALICKILDAYVSDQLLKDGGINHE